MKTLAAISAVTFAPPAIILISASRITASTCLIALIVALLALVVAGEIFVEDVHENQQWRD